MRTPNIPGILNFIILLMIISSCSTNDKARDFFLIESDGTKLKVETVTDSISVPFGMTFLPDGRLLVTDRPKGNILIVDIESGAKELLENSPAVVGRGDGGMLDIILHPDFENNGWIYFSCAIEQDSMSTMVVERAKIEGNKLVSRERIFTALPWFKDPSHFGSRMLLRDGYLFVTMGERFDLRDSAQTLANHLGKVLRLFEDGTVPKDNPFVNTVNAKPEIWSYGHRNPQGLAWHPVTGDLWEHEHGPKGGDEINIIKPGLNYGWPVISYGINYDDMPVGEGITEHEGMEQPVYFYKPSIAPSGMEFYTSDVIPGWKGNLFIGAMALHHLNRLVIENDKVVKEERLLTDNKWRVRSVKTGPDGYLYLGIDGGKIVRIVPN